jgi:hypothetical protein
MCQLENSNPDNLEMGVLDGDLWLCEHLFYDLLYEFPRFVTRCTAKPARRLLGEEV